MVIKCALRLPGSQRSFQLLVEPFVRW